MKKGLILFGTLSLGLLTACIVLNNNQIEEGNYQSRVGSFLPEANEAQGWLEYQHKLKGDYTQQDYQRAWQQVQMMGQSNRAQVTWWEHGPDNIGGRCRAIMVDQDNINHVYAGSVSGGLFESWERANFWVPVLEFDDNHAVSSICQTMDGTVYVATGYSVEITGGSQQGYDTGANGNGLYVLNRNSSGVTTSVDSIDGSQNYNYINEIVADDVTNRVWIATAQGLKRYTPGVGLEDITTATGGTCKALDISSDGKVIVANMGSGRTNVSVDAGVNWIDASGAAATEIPSGSPRIEYAISHEKATNGNYYVYAVMNSLNGQYLKGVYMSQDNGLTWVETAPSNDNLPGSFGPFSLGFQGQAYYDMIISVQKGNPEKMYLGGIQMYSWGTTGNWEQISNSYTQQLSPLYVHADQHEIAWDSQGRMYIGNDGGVFFSDDNGQSFHPANRGFNVTQFYEIGASAHGDVIGGSQDNGCAVNYHDNSTWHEFDDVYGGDGFSSHISFINRDIIFVSSQYGGFARSGDRGENSSIFVPDEFAPIGTNNIGCTPGQSGGGGCGNFFSVSHLWENPNDTNSEDSVLFSPSQAYSTNDLIEIPSLTTGATIDYIATDTVVYDDTVYYDPGAIGEDSVITSIAPSNDYNLSVFDYSITFGAHPLSPGDSIYLIDVDTTVVVESTYEIPHYYATNTASPGDTVDLGNDTVAYGVSWTKLLVQDPYQSWFALGLGNGQGVWLTRNGLRLSGNSSDWFRVNHQNISEVSTMEFSRDGNHLFIGTWNGQLYRLSGIGNIYSPVHGDSTLDVNFNVLQANLATTWTQMPTSVGGIGITGIAVGSNPNHVVITTGEFASTVDHVWESTNADGALTFSSISGGGTNFPSGLPVYSCVIDRNDANMIFVGTEMGVFISDDGGSTWENSSHPFGNTPVYDMLQNWRTFDEGCYRPGEIYIGTHGRGIFSTEDLLSTPEQDQLDKDKYIPQGINIYPNPMQDQGTIAFELENASNVNVQIFSLSGQLVREINETNLSPGQNNIEFGVSELPKGTYIVKLTADDRVETSKFIKH